MANAPSKVRLKKWLRSAGSQAISTPGKRRWNTATIVGEASTAETSNPSSIRAAVNGSPDPAPTSMTDPPRGSDAAHFRMVASPVVDRRFMNSLATASQPFDMSSGKDDLPREDSLAFPICQVIPTFDKTEPARFRRARTPTFGENRSRGKLRKTVSYCRRLAANPISQDARGNSLSSSSDRQHTAFQCSVVGRDNPPHSEGRCREKIRSPCPWIRRRYRGRASEVKASLDLGRRECTFQDPTNNQHTYECGGFRRGNPIDAEKSARPDQNRGVA